MLYAVVFVPVQGEAQVYRRDLSRADAYALALKKISQHMNIDQLGTYRVIRCK
jgi:hypothetical protein